MRADALKGLSRVLLAIAASMALTLAAAVCFAVRAPLAGDVRFSVAFFGAIPLWVALMCAGFLARNLALAWAVYGGLTAVLVLLIL